MNSRLPHLRIASLLVMILFIHCGKEKIYKKYTGTFSFHIYTKIWRMNQGTTDTTYAYLGTIEESPTSDPGQPRSYATINIHYASGVTIMTAIDKNGAFPTTKIRGGFTDSGHLTFVVESGGLSANYTDSVIGIRH